MNEEPKLEPQPPEIFTREMAGIGGKVGTQPADFVVDEIPRYSLSGEGEHRYVRLRKQLLTTPDLIRAVARAAGVPEREIGCAGMKDKHAVTSQWLSLPARSVPPDQWTLPAGIELLDVSRHERKLRTGQLAGNRFCIRLVDVSDGSLQRGELICQLLQERGLPNYFGFQRFSSHGDNLDRALRWLRQGSPRGKRARFYRKLYPSVIQSEVFNRTLTLRLQRGLDSLVAGDVVRLEGSHAVFVVEDPAREAARLESGDIHLTGPMIGPKMKSPTGAALTLEEAAAHDLGLTSEDLAGLGRIVDGTRRDLFVSPHPLSLRQLDDGSLLLDFTLPAGSYATQLVRELTRTEWRAGDRASG
jgi:tRNA pseudouridine13 synthase